MNGAQGEAATVQSMNEQLGRLRRGEGGLPVPWGWVLSESAWVAFPVGGVVKWKILRHWAGGVQ